MEDFPAPVTWNQLIEAFISIKKVGRGYLSARYPLRQYLHYCQQSGGGINRLSAESYSELSLAAEGHGSIIRKFVSFYEEIGRPIVLPRPEEAIWWDKAQSLGRRFIRDTPSLSKRRLKYRWRALILNYVAYGVAQERQAFPPAEHSLVG